MDHEMEAYKRSEIKVGKNTQGIWDDNGRRFTDTVRDGPEKSPFYRGENEETEDYMKYLEEELRMAFLTGKHQAHLWQKMDLILEKYKTFWDNSVELWLLSRFWEDQ